MAEYRIALAADAEIAVVLARSEEEFGSLGRARYAALIGTAMEDVAQNPQSPLVKWKQLSRIHVGVYRLDHSREHVPDPAGRVRAPRHALILRVAHDGVVEFIGIIHDHMLRGRALRKIIRANPDDA